MTLILAIVPVLLLIVLMAFFKMPGDRSSVISLIVTMLIALFGFHFAIDDLACSFLYGALKAVSPILIIIVMAIFSYNVLLKTRKMEIIKQQFTSISTDKSIQVLLLTWGFGGLLEAMAGFGTAVAIPAAILISLGFKPVFSAVVSLIANSVATAFGAIGTPVLVLAKETSLDVQNLSTNVVLQLSVLMFLIPLVLLFLTDPKLKSLPKNLFLALLVGGVSLTSQYMAARYMGAESPAIIGSILSIIVIVIYGKLTAPKEERARKNPLRTKDILNAWSIYLLILLLIILTLPYIEKVFYISIGCGDFLREVYKLPEEKIEFYSLGGNLPSSQELDQAKNDVIKELNLRADNILFLQAGKFDENKKLVEMLETFKKIKNDQLIFILIGSLSEDIKEKVEALIAEDSRVRYLGWRDGNELNRYLNACDIYVQPGKVSAIAQNAICRNSVVILNNLKEYRPFVNGNGWLINNMEEASNALTAISLGKVNIDEMKMISRAIAEKFFDYKTLARRLYE